MYSILCIDDEEQILKSLHDILQHHGLACHTASSGASGLELLRSERIDLVLLDASMPIMNGYETLKQIRTICDVPVVMLTGYASYNQAVSQQSDPPDSFIQKPTTSAHLLETIHYLLGSVAEYPESRA